MRELPILLAALLLIAQGLAELAAMRLTGSLGRRWSPEWTFRAVNLPYRLMFAAGIAEQFLAPRPSHPIMLATGTALAAAGVVLRVVCHFQLGYHFSPYVELADAHQLTEQGLYRYVRHPMYLGTVLIVIGVPLLLASMWAVPFAVLSLVGLVMRIRKEEQFLREHLAGYDDYAARTWQIVPWVW